MFRLNDWKKNRTAIIESFKQETALQPLTEPLIPLTEEEKQRDAKLLEITQALTLDNYMINGINFIISGTFSIQCINEFINICTELSIDTETHDDIENHPNTYKPLR